MLNLPNFENALSSLGIVGWRVTGQKEPSNEDEFNATFQREMGVTKNKLVFSNDPSDFGVTWSQIKSAKDTLQSDWEAKEYSRNRQDQYPSLESVTVALAEKAEGNSQMWDTITAERLAVKSKFPKP